MTLSVQADIERRFGFRAHTNEQIGGTLALANIVGRAAWGLAQILPEGRERSLALTHMEEALFWANAAIARQEGNS